jgi:hypothetical protein
MHTVTLCFANGSQMALFIIDTGISDYVPDWKNSSLTGNIEKKDIDTALEVYNAFVSQKVYNDFVSEKLLLVLLNNR